MTTNVGMQGLIAIVNKLQDAFAHLVRQLCARSTLTSAGAKQPAGLAADRGGRRAERWQELGA